MHNWFNFIQFCNNNNYCTIQPDKSFIEEVFFKGKHDGTLVCHMLQDPKVLGLNLDKDLKFVGLDLKYTLYWMCMFVARYHGLLSVLIVQLIHPSCFFFENSVTRRICPSPLTQFVFQLTPKRWIFFVGITTPSSTPFPLPHRYKHTTNTENKWKRQICLVRIYWKYYQHC